MDRWRADFKWVFGIVFTLVLIFALLMLAMFQATGRGRSEKVITSMKQTLVSDARFREELSLVAPDILDFLESPDFSSRVYEDPAYLQNKVEAIPAANQPLPGAPDTAGSAREVAQSTRSLLEVYITPVSFLSSGVHSFVKWLLTAALIMAAIAAVPFIMLSRGLGRFVSAGVSIAIASWGPFLLLSLLKGATLGWTPGRSGEGESFEQRRIIEEGVNQFGQNLVDASLSVYTFFSLLALLLLLGAAAGYLLLKPRAGR